MGGLRIDVWSDVACPWCWVGKRHLEAALAAFDHEVDVAWRSFELDPRAPKQLDGSVDYVERLAKKYGTSREGAQSMIDRMTQTGADSGIEFRFDRAQPGNTFDAHRLLCWAYDQGRQNELKEQLFVAYMNEGKSIAEHAVLEEVAARSGLDRSAAQLLLSSDQHADTVRAEEALATQLGIRGVPFFLIDRRFAIQGAQPSELILEGLNRALHDGEPPEAAGEGEVCEV